jgi:predicted O-linked N-acetylglucosamine transferase (SPINDLY family)
MFAHRPFLLRCAALALALAAASSPPPPPPLSARRLRRLADAAWARALAPALPAAAAAATVAEAQALYAQAAAAAPADASLVYEAAFTAAVGGLPARLPPRAAVAGALRGELARSAAVGAPHGRSEVSQLVALCMLDGADLLAVSRAWASTLGAADDHLREIDAPPTLPREGRPARSPPLRVGYLSGHFGDHPVGHHAGALLRSHNRSRVEVLCFPTVASDGSAFARRNLGACDSVTFLAAPPVAAAGGDEAASAHAHAATLRAARLDALIYLDGYDASKRIDVLTQLPRVAPLVAGWFGYLATLGSAQAANAIIADAASLPLADEARFYAESLVLRLPTTFFVSDHAVMHPEVLGAPRFPWPPPAARSRGAAAARFEAALRSAAAGEGGGGAAGAATVASAAEGVDGPPAPFTFCCSSQLFKLSAEALSTFLDVLRRAPGARLVLMDHPPTARANLEAHLAATVPELAARVAFLPLLPRAEHLLAKRASCALGLDTPFYNGHVTTVDLLWAGVPVLTYAHNESAMAGKAAASVIAAAGAPRAFYAAGSLAEYADTAVGVWAAYEAARRGAGAAAVLVAAEDGAVEPPARAAEDQLLWRPSHEAALFDSARFARELEDALERALLSD